ncbi:hypothetical protein CAUPRSCDRAFT_13242 [Caulochytrium protostelioides]|uniref:NYN domain-containing protein n=1 Tax=Caulochytrium protostelioides TaxID=1555241 RepID=A0A4P9WQQ7_9FUNG|nr:hypothetical protein CAUPRSCDRAFT_13242 [Caulochytrium protostelioides]
MSRPCVVEPVVIVDSGGYENALYNSRRGCAVCPDPWLWLFKHKDAADIQLIVEIFLWMERVKPPAVLVLVSSDGDFHQVLNIALTRGYTVVVVHNSALSEKLQVLPVVHVLSDVLRGRVTAKPRVSRDHISFFSNPIVGADNEFNIRFRHAFAEYLRS